MSKQKFLGEFELMVLAALLRLEDNAYGVSIISEIETRAERSVSIGALYATLDRLEKKQFISASMGEATPQRGGRAKRYFKITKEGQAQMYKSLNALQNMLEGTPIWSGGALA